MDALVKKYLKTKGIFFYGIPTAIISFIIYLFLYKADFDLAAIAADLPLSCFITIFICVLSGIPGFRADAKKGTAPEMPFDVRSHVFYRRMPKNLLLQSLWLAAWGTIKYVFIPVGFLFCFFPGLVVAKNVYLVIKSVYAGFYVCQCIRLAAACNVALVQNKYNAELD